MLSSVDGSLLELCALFAPPLALSLLALAHALHRSDFRLWQAKLRCYDADNTLHLSAKRPPAALLDSTTQTLPASRVVDSAPQPSAAWSVKSAVALLPPHRQREERARGDTLRGDRMRGDSNGTAQPAQASGESLAWQREGGAALYTALVRFRASRWLSAALFLLALCLPALQLAAWTAALLAGGYGQSAAVLLLLTACVAAVGLALGGWQRSGWRWSAHVSRLLGLSLLCFLGLSLLLTYLSAQADPTPLSFFSRSVHLVTLHLLVSVECRAVLEQEEAAALLPYIRAQPRDTRHEDDARRAERRRKRARRLDAVRRLLHVHIAPHEHEVKEEEEERGEARAGVGQAGSESDGADSDGDADSASPTRLSELPSHTHSFDSHVQAKAAKARLKQRSASQRRLLTLRLVGLLILAAYSLLIGLQVDAPSDDADSSAPSFDGRFLGLLVSLSILLFDLCLSLLSARLSTAAQLSLALVTRLVLVAFDASGWFLSFCLLFLLYACTLSYLWADSFLPLHSLSSRRLPPAVATRPVRMTLSSLLAHTSGSSAALTGTLRPLMSALQSADSLLSLPAFLSLTLTTLFLCATAVAYTTHPPLVSLPGVSDVQFEQWAVGVLSLLLSLLLASVTLLVKSLLFFSFRLTRLTCGASVLLELLCVGCGLYVWREFDSLLVLLLLALLPPFGISLLAAYCLSIASLPARYSVRSLLACTASVLLLSALGVSLSELYSPSLVGWSTVLCVLVVLSSALPLVKYRCTLELDALDEGCVLLCLALLSGFLALLSWRLALSSLGNYLLALGGTGYVLAVLLAAAWTDWRLHARLTPVSLFVLSAHYVWLLALSAALFALFSPYVAVCALVGVALYSLLSACLLAWLWCGSALPLALRWLLVGVLSLLLAAGVCAAVYLSASSPSDSPVPFAAFSAVYLFLALCVALCSLFAHYGALWRAPSLVHFSPAVFPVHLFDLRSGAVSHFHSPLCLLLCSAALCLLWTTAAILCQYRNVGLSSSALLVAVLWLLLRQLSFSAPRELLPLRAVLDEHAVCRVRGEAWRVTCQGYDADENMLEAVAALQQGRDARRGLRDSQRARRRRMRLSSSSNPLAAAWQLATARAEADPLDCDWLLALLSHGEWRLQRVCGLQSDLDAQCTFLLRLEGATRRREDESLFALFAVWAAKHAPSTPRLHADMQPADADGWTAAERRSVRLAVDDFVAHRAGRREEAEKDRLVEEYAARRREQSAHTQREAASEPSDSDGSGDGGGADLYGSLQPAGQARGSSAPVFTANRARNTATQRHNRMKASSSRQQQADTVRGAGKKKASQRNERHRTTVLHSGADAGRALSERGGQARAPSTTVQPADEAQRIAEQVSPTAEEGCGVEAQQPATSQSEQDQPARDEGGGSTEQLNQLSPAVEQWGVESAAEAAQSAPLSVPAVLHSHEEAHALFSRIAAECARTGVAWVDESFPACDASIYLGGVREPSRPSAVHQAVVAGWQRPEAVLQAVRDNGAVDGSGSSGDRVVRVVADGYSCSDVVQGNIGTCYFLSALGVMALHSSQDGSPSLLSASLPALYNESPSHPSGCYLVCFYRRHAPLYVFVDDLLPVQPNGLPAFSHCRHAGELWVALLEKAYAKLFGAYEAIEAGYVHQALMDCTSGQGEELRLKDEEGRLRQTEDALWLRLYDAWRAGCMLGAGSSTGTNDHEVDGIVQGHAYGIIGMYEGSASEQAEGGGPLRLLQLNNPWGRGEWTGAWSDDSDRWTRFYRNRLQPSTQDDGRFWMELADFAQHFDNVYLCRIMPHAATLDSAWDAQRGTACGPRQPRNNPHFRVRAERATTAHIELEQDADAAAAASRAVRSGAAEAVDGVGSNGYAYIQFYLLDNGGQRCDKIVRAAVRGWANDGRLVNARSISAQVELEAGKDYALLCCTNTPNVERAFSVSVFSCEPVSLTATC